MIKCRDLDKLITSDELIYKSWIKRLEVKLHLLMCRHCSRMKMQIELIRSSARGLWEVMERPDPAEHEHGLESRLLHRLLKRK